MAKVIAFFKNKNHSHVFFFLYVSALFSFTLTFLPTDLVVLSDFVFLLFITEISLTAPCTIQQR